MEQELLKAYVTFAAKDQEAVMATAKRIEDAIKGVSGGAKIKFEASGVEKVEGAVGALKQKFAQLAQGGDLTRMLSGSIEEAFKLAGEGAGGVLSQGIGAAIGGALGATLGASLAEHVLALPLEMYRERVHEKETEEVQTLRETPLPGDEKPRRVLRRNDLTFEGGQWEEEQETEIRAKGRIGAWQLGFSGTKVKQADLQNAAALLTSGGKMSSDEAEKLVNQFAALEASGTGDTISGLASGYSRLAERGLDAREHRGRLVAFLAAHNDIDSALREGFEQKYSKQHSGMSFEKWRESGAVNEEMLNTAIAHAAQSNVKFLKQQQTGSGSGWRLFGDAFHTQDLKAVEEHYKRIGMKAPEVKTPGYGSYTPVQEMYGLNSQTPEWGAEGKVTAGPREYSFTSLSGLAEKMQQEAAGGGDVQEQQLSVLTEIRDRLPGQSVPGGHGEQDHERHRAQ